MNETKRCTDRIAERLRRRAIEADEGVAGNSKRYLDHEWAEYPQLHDATWLRWQWEHEGLDVRDVAEIVGCRPVHVRRALNHHEIPIRRSRPPHITRLLRAVERQRGVRV